MAGLHINGDTYIGTTGIKIKDCIKESLPVGTIIEYPSTGTLPTGFLACEGQAVSRTSYADLFAVIGTSFGSGDGSTTFNLPNKRGRVTVGRDTDQTEFTSMGQTGGHKKMQSHTHGMQGAGSHNHTVNNGTVCAAEWGWLTNITGFRVGDNIDGYRMNSMQGVGNHTHTIDSYGEGNAQNLQPYLVSRFIIKVSKTSVMTSGSVVDNLDGSSTTDAPSVRSVKAALNGYCNDIAYICGDGNTPEKTYTAWTAQKVTALTQGGQHGSGLTADPSHQKIIINRACTMIRVSASYNWYNNLIGGDHVLHIKKNGQSLRDAGYVAADKNYCYYSQISNTLVISSNFAVNDYLELYLTVGASGTERTFSGNNHFVVEIIQ